MSPPISTIIQPLCLAGMLSAIKVNMMGNMPPTPQPITKHMTQFIQKPGMEPQALVAMNVIPAINMEDFLPILSPSHPQIKEPITVPVMPHNGSKATGILALGNNGDLKTYSLATPGTTNDKIVGFITSRVMATAITNKSPICVRLIGASSSALTFKSKSFFSLITAGGIRLY